ncbi:hypothetical protein Ahu01nite_017120 [Winogradskya humida]|uniref:Phosphotransferase family enzyme n=1 Tax=Winogradskya humida TaxID=113566 RepID=A0ABQ3ZJ47_9ACTN|nr:hypothetical protein Ahu01nite_017120 [Actinoplanes humidus]
MDGTTLVHTDLGPANLIVTPRGLRIADWGEMGGEVGGANAGWMLDLAAWTSQWAAYRTITGRLGAVLQRAGRSRS